MKGGFLLATLFYASYGVALSQTVDKNKPYARICLAVVNSSTGEGMLRRRRLTSAGFFGWFLALSGIRFGGTRFRAFGAVLSFRAQSRNLLLLSGSRVENNGERFFDYASLRSE